MIKRVFRQMTGPQIISAMTVTLCLLIDSIVIGRLIGVDAMSAYGLANPVLIIFGALGTMEACGVQVLTGEAIGKGDTKACSTVFSTSVVMALIMAAAWIVLVFAAIKPLCMLLGTGIASPDNPLYMMTADYLRGYMIGAPFFFLSQIMVPYLQVMGKRKLTLISVLVMTVTDIVCDILSVYVFHAGMFGIGLASSLSYLAALLAGIAYFMRSDCLFRFDKGSIKAETALKTAHAGSPIMVNQAGFMVRVYVINRLLLAVAGAYAVAVFTVISTIGNIIFSIGLGSGSVTLMLASIFYSEEDRSSLYDLVRIMTVYSLAQIICAAAAVELAAPWLAGLFLGSDPSVISVAVPALRIYVLSLIACVMTTVYKNYYQGTGRMGFTNMISLCDNMLLLIPFTLLFSRLMGLTGVWIGIVAGQFSVLVMIAIVVWKRYGRISFSAEAFSMLDPDFGADPSEVFETSVTDMDTAISASEQIAAFCIEKGLRNRLAMLVSLCVEEIVVNIIKYGFGSDDKPHNADVRLVIDESKCIIRIRDNCTGFDPTDHVKLQQSDDPAKHIGIRLVMSLANDVNYINSLGLNNLYMSLSK